ncbi:lipoprotein [Streptomyces sp. 351MFTsu5.1]|uniref:lipoprotein n=1 Tax=Streptomyces sp. 351MFTsu5.1 TaxID=1172180 RepID=UPI000399BD48|nr:lipoprotein [Streptomyces sp. 351MFTsu5.1]
MNVTSKKNRRRPMAVGATVLGACMAGALLLTGCNGKEATTSSVAGTNPTKAAATGGKETATSAASKAPLATASAGSISAAKSPGAVPAASKSPVATASPAGGTDDDGCDHKMPISPDEVAVYRYTPEGGSLSLIVKYGNWGCGSPDSDGAPFETVGKETFIPMDQAADVTVTNPIVESTENQHIGVQEFLDWLEAHPNSGLVFTYHLGADGAIDRLDEVFTP